jgi:hypothetical protein
MKPELLRKAMAKIDSVFSQAADPLTAGNTEFSEERKKSIEKGLWHKSPQRMRWERIIRKVPDKKFEELMSSFDGIAAQIHKSFKEAAANAPKDLGGRPPNFPLKVRRQAIQDLGQDLARGSTFSEAVEIVAKRHGMETGYLRSIWKNRKRLNRD